MLIYVGRPHSVSRPLIYDRLGLKWTVFDFPVGGANASAGDFSGETTQLAMPASRRTLLQRKGGWAINRNVIRIITYKIRDFKFFRLRTYEKRWVGSDGEIT